MKRNKTVSVLPQACGHPSPFSSSCVTYGLLMCFFLSHAPSGSPRKRLHVSAQLSALIKLSTREPEPEKVEVFFVLPRQIFVVAAINRDSNSPSVLSWRRSVDLHNTCQSARKCSRQCKTEVKNHPELIIATYICVVQYFCTILWI